MKVVFCKKINTSPKSKNFGDSVSHFMKAEPKVSLEVKWKRPVVRISVKFRREGAGVKFDDLTTNEGPSEMIVALSAKVRKGQKIICIENKGLREAVDYALDEMYQPMAPDEKEKFKKIAYKHVEKGLEEE